MTHLIWSTVFGLFPTPSLRIHMDYTHRVHDHSTWHMRSSWPIGLVVRGVRDSFDLNICGVFSSYDMFRCDCIVFHFVCVHLCVYTYGLSTHTCERITYSYTSNHRCQQHDPTCVTLLVLVLVHICMSHEHVHVNESYSKLRHGVCMITHTYTMTHTDFT